MTSYELQLLAPLVYNRIITLEEFARIVARTTRERDKKIDEAKRDLNSQAA